MRLTSRVLFVVSYFLVTFLGLPSCNKANIESFPCENVTFFPVDFNNLVINETGYYLSFTIDIDTIIPSAFQNLVILKSTDFGHKWEIKNIIDSLWLCSRSSCIDYNNKIYFFVKKDGYYSEEISICSYDYEQNIFEYSFPYFDSFGRFICDKDSLFCYDWNSLYYIDDKLNVRQEAKGISKYRVFSMVEGKPLMYTKYEQKFTDLSTDSLIQSPVTIDAIQCVGDSLFIMGRKGAVIHKVIYDLKKRSFSEMENLKKYNMVGDHKIISNGDSLFLAFLSKKRVYKESDLYYTKNNGKDWKFIYGIDIDYFHDPYCLYKDTLFYIKGSRFSDLSIMNKVILE